MSKLLYNALKISGEANSLAVVRIPVGRERVGTRSHTCFLVTRLEHMYFYSDFLGVATDVNE